MGIADSGTYPGYTNQLEDYVLPLPDPNMAISAQTTSSVIPFIKPKKESERSFVIFASAHVAIHQDNICNMAAVRHCRNISETMQLLYELCQNRHDSANVNGFWQTNASLGKFCEWYCKVLSELNIPFGICLLFLFWWWFNSLSCENCWDASVAFLSKPSGRNWRDIMLFYSNWNLNRSFIKYTILREP